jgi:hypothetical protein
VAVGVGITSLPSVRSTEGQFPYWLGVDDRLIADEFFRGSYTSGVWLKGELHTKVKYHAMFANNLSTLGVSASQLDNKLDTQSFSVQWLPTTGEFGLWRTFGDYDDHQNVATRLGVHYTHSLEEKQSQPGTEGIENSQIRLTDGSVIFTPDLFGPASPSTKSITTCRASTPVSSTSACRSRAKSTGAGCATSPASTPGSSRTSTTPDIRYRRPRWQYQRPCRSTSAPRRYSETTAILHNDIDMPFGKVDTEPVYLTQMKDLLKRHPKTTIIWAHTGLGRVVRPVQVSAEAAERTPTHLQILEDMIDDRSLGHVVFDISWDEVAKYAVSSPETTTRVTSLFNQHADRFLFGTDTVALSGPQPYYAVFDQWAPVWKGLTPEASLKVRKGNYERIFNEGRQRLRQWEKTNVKGVR